LHNRASRIGYRASDFTRDFLRRHVESDHNHKNKARQLGENPHDYLFAFPGVLPDL
jgi:hypothetical protein